MFILHLNHVYYWNILKSWAENLSSVKLKVCPPIILYILFVLERILTPLAFFLRKTLDPTFSPALFVLWRKIYTQLDQVSAGFALLQILFRDSQN